MKYLFYILFFLAAGEVIFQIDFFLAGNTAIKDVKNKITPTNIISKNKIFLLGDSYTKGLGIAENERIANQLQVKDFALIDSSNSGDNWADYLSVYNSLSGNLHTNDIVVIGVNWNDVAFNKGAINAILHPEILKTSGLQQNTIRRNKEVTGLRKIVHQFYLNSKMINFLSSNFQNTLKRKGMPLPIGDFNYFRRYAYKEKSIELLSCLHHIDSINTANHTTTILYLMPNFNLTNHIEYFRSFIDFFEQNQYKTIKVINGPKQFYTSKDGYYCLSIHDGHPNGLAHIEISKRIKKEIESIRSYTH